jgi:hypothetical protein
MDSTMNSILVSLCYNTFTVLLSIKDCIRISLDVSHLDYPSIPIPPSSILQGFSSPLQVVKTMLKESILPMSSCGFLIVGMTHGYSSLVSLFYKTFIQLFSIKGCIRIYLDVSHIDYPSITIPPIYLLQGFSSPLQVVKTMLKEVILPISSCHFLIVGMTGGSSSLVSHCYKTFIDFFSINGCIRISLDVSHIDYPSILIPPSSLLQGFSSPL